MSSFVFAVFPFNVFDLLRSLFYRSWFFKYILCNFYLRAVQTITEKNIGKAHSTIKFHPRVILSRASPYHDYCQIFQIHSLNRSYKGGLFSLEFPHKPLIFRFFSRDAVVWNRIKITQNMPNIRLQICTLTKQIPCYYFCLQVDVWTLLNDVWKWIEETILNQQISTRIKI